MKKQYRTVSIPAKLAKEAEQYLYDDGYVSLGDLVRDLLRDWIWIKKREMSGSIKDHQV